MALELEDELRRAMRADTHGLRVGADLVDRVRTAHTRRTRRRRRTAAALLAAAVAVAAYPAYQAAAPEPPAHNVVSPPGDPGARAGTGKGVVLGEGGAIDAAYLPAGAVYEGSVTSLSDAWTSVEGTWTMPGGGRLTLSILRAPLAGPEDLKRLPPFDGVSSWERVPLPAGPALRKPDGTQMLWLVRPGVALHVAMTPASAGELLKIARSLTYYPTTSDDPSEKGARSGMGPGDALVDDFEVAHIPPGLQRGPLDGSPEAGGRVGVKAVEARWYSPQEDWSERGPRLTVYVMKVPRSWDEARLHAESAPGTGRPVRARVGGEDGVLSGEPGRTRILTWIPEPGVGIQVRARGYRSDAELLKVAASVRRP
ncbi:hypothetical protein [Bailinhaonella thermotolerans]|uniref:Uncharacterized protein n=1 Tax=Bailinhaonella thermotolerans TaxID=1070861 RepID=A0A3A4AZX1_9ACTN|nr:hypothetical protein [Bailinhaonella thermotolerans]RJL30760.1 hypothetical protein D5H75_20795 [Bailinhaonella thermotolerans]